MDSPGVKIDVKFSAKILHLAESDLIGIIPISSTLDILY